MFRGQPRTLLGAVVVPFVEFFRRLGWRSAVLVLLFCATYKWGEQFAQLMTPKFYRDTGFTKTEIGIASKAVGFAAWLVGGALGGPLVAKYGVRRTLVAFGFAQATTHLAYLGIAAAGYNLYVFSIAIFIENVSFAMATSAFVASQMSFTSPAVSVTQYALLTSLSGVGQNVFGFLTGPLVENLGWQGFFVATMAMCLPGIVLAWLAIRSSERRGSASTSSAASPA
jgi:PAT family beta-lactamase induction signal transducer AmpG